VLDVFRPLDEEGVVFGIIAGAVWIFAGEGAD
jgi:hypothetical protein